MKYWLPILALLIASSASAQAPVITQSAPVVNQGATLQFTETLGEAGTWSCPGCAGSITSGGLYTAPATVTPQQTAGGRPIFSNSSIFNTNISATPLRSDNATLMTEVGTANLTIGGDSYFPVNYCNGSTPLVNMGFHYTPGNNGNFQIPSYPGAKIEGGWLTRNDGNIDHHLICIDTTDGTFQEMYDYVPRLATTAASVTGNVATLTLASNPITEGFVAGLTYSVDVFTGADTYFNQASGVVLTAVTSTSVSYALTHANASASTNGIVGWYVDCPSAGLNTCNSGSGIRYAYSTYNLPNAQDGGVDAAGLYLMPVTLRLQEMERAIATAGTINHPLRMSLSNGFICGSSLANACYTGQPGGSRHIWPGTAEALIGGGNIPYGMVFRLKSSFNISTFSAAAQIILTEMKNYGIILADGGSNWAIQIEAAPWPLSIRSAFDEITAAGIAPSNFEVPDLLTLQATASQTCPTPNNCSLANVAPERVTFTRTSDSATASVDVSLMGVAVGMPNDEMDIQAGTAAQQLTAFVSGGATNTVTWSVSPAITGGSLTSGGLLTPPATIAAVTPYTVTATSVDDGSVSAVMTVNILPTGSIYLRPGAPGTSYTDSGGHVWAPYVYGTGVRLGCCGDLSGGSWGALVDKQIYYYRALLFNTDNFFNFSVPNGTYNVTVKLATDQASAGGTVDSLETQGTLVYLNQDVFTVAGGNYKPADFVLPATVSNGNLQVVIRNAQVGGLAILNAIQIDQVSTPVPAAPSKVGILLMAKEGKN